MVSQEALVIQQLNNLIEESSAGFAVGRVAGMGHQNVHISTAGSTSSTTPGAEGLVNLKFPSNLIRVEGVLLGATSETNQFWVYLFQCLQDNSFVFFDFISGDSLLKLIKVSQSYNPTALVSK